MSDEVVRIREGTPDDLPLVLRHRRQGLARQLMDAMIAWCTSEGYATLYLHASDEARPLHSALGFVATNEMRLTLS